MFVCLGIQVTKDPKSKTITLIQSGLIEQVIQQVALDVYSKGKGTPTDTILYADFDGPLRWEQWYRRSILGALN